MATILDMKLPRAIAAALRIPPNDAKRQQIRVLKKLLKKAKFTEFGQKFSFDDILLSPDPGKNSRNLFPYMIMTKFMSNGGKRRWKECRT